MFIIEDKTRSRGEDVQRCTKGYGVVRDKELKLENDEVSHTLG